MATTVLFHVLCIILCIALTSAVSVNRFFASNESKATVSVNTDDPLYVTDDRYLSLGMDSNLIRDRWNTFDFNSVRLKTLAKGLTPAYMRLMGTDGDRMVFVRDDLPAGQQESLKSWPFPKTTFNMTSSDWDSINKWTAEVGWRLLFGINAQTRRPLNYGNGTYWDGSNALELLDYSVEKGYASNLDFEFGNEPNIWNPGHHFKSVSPDQLGEEFRNFRRLLNTLYGDDFRKSLLIGPDVGDTGFSYLEGFLNNCDRVINATTFHTYYGVGYDYRTSEKYLDPLKLDKYIGIAKSFIATVKASKQPNVALWQGETSSTVTPPGNGIDETYVASFMLLDKLGLSARLGLSLVVRQTFYGLWFALVDNDLEPRPNYWLSLMFKRLVGREVLDSKVDMAEGLNVPARVRLYAHCTSERSGYAQGSVVVYVMNMFNNSVSLRFNDSLTSGDVHQFLWTPPNGNLTSEKIMLNGNIVNMVSDQELPVFKPVVLKASDSVTMPNFSSAFYVFPDVKVKKCMSGLNPDATHA